MKSFKLLIIEGANPEFVDYYESTACLYLHDHVERVYTDKLNITPEFPFDGLVTHYVNNESYNKYLQSLRLKGVMVLVEFDSEEETFEAIETIAKGHTYEWERFNENGYEVTTKGDIRFSPYFMIYNGRSIENYYQLSIKGYELLGYESWRDVKGRVPLKWEFTRFTRQDALDNPNKLYLFTDNLNRSSGSNPIDEDSWYVKKYADSGQTLYYPTMSQAVVRGCPNACPVTTMKNQWRTQLLFECKEDYDNMEEIWSSEVDTVLNMLKTGKYDTIVCGSSPIGNGTYSKLYFNTTAFKLLQKQLRRIGINNTPSNISSIYPENPQEEYKVIMMDYLKRNPSMLYELACIGKERVFTDVFAVSNNSQAYYYAKILNLISQ